MPSKKDVAGVRAIGIDTGKNTLHMVGLGSGLIDYSQKMTMAAMQIADMNV